MKLTKLSKCLLATGAPTESTSETHYKDSNEYEYDPGYCGAHSYRNNTL